MKKRLFFMINQFYKGGAEVALLNLLYLIPKEEYEVDFLISDQIILTNAYSLINEIPFWVNVCNASEKEGKYAIVNKVINKALLVMTGKQRNRKAAYKFVKNKEYDYAFSIGEWLSPEFVARHVNAKKKAVWIHTDIDKAAYVNPKILFGFDDKIDQYIFVSNNSMKSAVSKFTKIKNKSRVIYNIIDEERIKKLSELPILCDMVDSEYSLLTVANFREEKNYIRQVEVMRILKDRGLNIKWFNVGSTANSIYYNKVKKKLMDYGLEDNFVIVGVDENPYKYMSKVDAVTVLSDFESWSMVITEAKVVGTPVIATKTSGALEQIQDGVNGRLADFNEIDIANKVEEYLRNHELADKLRSNLQDYTISRKAITSFLELIEEK